MELERSAPEAFDIVHEAVKRLGWNIVLAEPADGDSPGQIEATDRTLLVGFTDDVAIRVTGDDSRAKIDVRSVSRYGWHDLGANAERIGTFFAEVQSALEKGEKTGLGQVEPAPKAVQKTVKKPKRKRDDRPNRRSTAPEPRQPLLSPD